MRVEIVQLKYLQTHLGTMNSGIDQLPSHWQLTLKFLTTLLSDDGRFISFWPKIGSDSFLLISKLFPGPH